MSVDEQWKPIPSLAPHYEASSLGRVRRMTPYVSTYPGKILVPYKDTKTRYLRVGISTNGRTHTRYVHRLVCEAFHGPAPTHREVAHLDGTRSNNRADNLRWCTKSENQSHKRLHGTYRCGVQMWNAKLDPDRVRLMRARVAFGEPISSVARVFRVSYAAAYSIAKGVHWRSAGGFGVSDE
jgi:hypothetical protein